MSYQVDTALVAGYRSALEIQFQQAGSRLRDAVDVEMQNSEYEYYDRIGPTSVSEILTRHSDTVLTDTPHTRRRLALRDFDWADLIDRPDKIRMLADPTSPYARNAAMAMGRKLDEIIIEAFTATAYTGKSGSSTVTTGWGTITGATTLATSHLVKAKVTLDANEAVSPGETTYIACRSESMQDLLSDSTLISADYNTVKALVAGEIDTWMGFKFIRTELLTEGEAFAFTSGAIKVGIGEELKVDIGPRRDKRNSVQVYVCMSMGAVRMWEEKIVKISDIAAVA